MGTISLFPTVASPADLLWQRYVALVAETRRNPLLVDDPAHLAARLEAHRRFSDAYSGGGR